MKSRAALRLAAIAAAVLSVTACSVLQEDKIDYKSAGKGVPLEVPPDLTQLSHDSRYQLPGGAVTASSYTVGQAAPSVPTAANTLGDVRIERDGQKRWLVVNRPADQLWQPVRDFWLSNGFLLDKDKPELGIMETDWAENRAKIPQDFIRNTLGKVLDSLYSTSERDRFRTRLERTANGGTEIYITHSGMKEVYDSATKDHTVWEPRPSDPELETEFLRRLMVSLGVPQEQAKNLVAAGGATPIAKVATLDGHPVVQIPEGFDRAWRRVGLSLDRTGFTVEDRDRSKGTYFVRYVEPTERKEPGIIDKLFRRENVIPPLKYRIAVNSQGDSTTVSVLNDKGAPDTSKNAQRIVQLIADDMKQ